jgi:hypothetical protein
MKPAACSAAYLTDRRTDRVVKPPAPSRQHRLFTPPHAFLKKNEITLTPLADVVAKLRAILAPALVQAATFSDASHLGT